MATATGPGTANKIPAHKARFYVPIKRTILELSDAFDRHGDVVQVTGFPVKIFCFRHPEHVKQILKHPEIGDQKFPKILPRVKWTMRSGAYILKGGREWRDRRGRSYVYEEQAFGTGSRQLENFLVQKRTARHWLGCIRWIATCVRLKTSSTRGFAKIPKRPNPNGPSPNSRNWWGDSARRWKMETKRSPSPGRGRVSVGPPSA